MRTTDEHPQDPHAILEAVRAKSLRAMLLTFLSMGGVVVGIMVVRKAISGAYGTALLFALLFGFVVVPTVASRLPYRTRAVAMLSALFGFGLLELYTYGLGSMNMPLFLTANLFAMGLLGVRTGVAFLAASLVAYAVCAFLYLTGRIPIEHPEQELSLQWHAWVTFVTSVTFLSLAGMFSLRSVLSGLVSVAEGNAELVRRQEKEIFHRKDVERELHDREERFKSFIENTNDAVWCYEFDPAPSVDAPLSEQLQAIYDGTLVECNDACAQAYGFPTHDAVLGKRFRDLIHGENESLDMLFRAFIAGGYRTEAFPSTEVTASGEERMFSNTAQGVVEDGRLVRVWGSFRDITEQHVARRDRAEAETRYRTLVRSIPGAVYRGVLGAHARPLYLSPWFEDITGYAPDEYLNQAEDFLETLVLEEDRDRVRDGIRAAEKYGVPYQMEYRVRHRDGGIRWVSDRGVVTVNSGDGNAMIEGVLFDITERYEAAEALRRNEERLLQTQKLEAIGQLAGGVAHDFNNVLQGIIGFSEMGAMLDGLPDAARSYFQRIYGSADRAATIVKQLLAFSRKEPVVMRLVDVAELAESTTAMLDPLLGERVELVMELDENLPKIRGDVTQLQQVLLNLAVNARDAMPGGGRLEIRIHTRPGPADGSDADDSLKGARHVCIAVQDNGVGIPMGVRDRIFDPFFTTKALGEGTGLGLSTVYGIVSQYGGSVDFDSIVGKGTTFYVRMPVARERKAAGPPPVQPTLPGSRPGGGCRLLLAEDEAVAREALAEILLDAGYEVIQAADGEEAIRRAEEQQGAIDLYLFDVVMPACNGSAALQHLRRSDDETPAILLTGYSAEHITEEALAHPHTHILFKPVSGAQLLEAIDSARAEVAEQAADN